MVFPFVKLCQNNQLVTFEILATLLGEPHCIAVHLLLDGGGEGACSKFSFPHTCAHTHTHTPHAVNWCSHWFEYFPNPPLNVLAMIENCLAHHDGQLLEHFIKHDITSHVRTLQTTVCFANILALSLRLSPLSVYERVWV